MKSGLIAGSEKSYVQAGLPSGIYFFLLMVLFIPSSHAQVSGRIRLAELISFQKSDFVSMNDILAKRGWEFRGSTKRNSDDPSAVTWAYGAVLDGIPYSDQEVSAGAWLILFTYDDGVSYLSYQAHNAQTYLSIKDEIRKYGMKIVKNVVAENEVTTAYAGKNYVVSISITTRAGSASTIYSFTVYPKFLYEIGELMKTSDPFSEKSQNSSSSLPNDFKYISKAFSYAQIYSDWRLSKGIYMIPPGESIYIIRERTEQGEKILYVYCNGIYGYMKKSMLRDW